MNERRLIAGLRDAIAAYNPDPAKAKFPLPLTINATDPNMRNGSILER